MIPFGDGLALDEAEIRIDFVRSPGPGGQNVNKVATAAQLRYDASRSPCLPEPVRERLLKLAGRRATSDGVIVIQARRFRTQEANRRDAVQRLVDLLEKAAFVPRARQKTRPTKASRERRLGEKRRRAGIKLARRPTPNEAD